MKASDKDIAFIASHEGMVTRAYRCPAGVITIGYGFTNRSRIFRDYWSAKHGRGLKLGDTIGRNEANQLLGKIIDGEYGAAVNARIEPKKQHHYGAASSMTYNCGTGALNWRWARALARGEIAESARLIRVTAVTANGRRLAGLVRRRADEARLIMSGEYGETSGPLAVSHGSEEVRWYQTQLRKLGHVLAVDGKAGPKTKAAVRAFQRKHKLVIDGIVGPATRAALIRAVDAQRTKSSGSAGAGAGAAAGAGSDIASTPDPSAVGGDILINALTWGVGAAIVVLALLLLYRHRGLFTGQRVPT